MIVLMIHHLLGLQPEENHLRVRPRLLPGLDRVTASLPLRTRRIRLNLRRAARDAPTTFAANLKAKAVAPGEIHLPYPEDDDVVIEAVVSGD
jgi:hypothetical protein